MRNVPIGRDALATRPQHGDINNELERTETIDGDGRRDGESQPDSSHQPSGCRVREATLVQPIKTFLNLKGGCYEYRANAYAC